MKLNIAGQGFKKEIVRADFDCFQWACNEHVGLDVHSRNLYMFRLTDLQTPPLLVLS